MITDVGIDLDGVMFDFSRVVTKHFSEYLDRVLPTPTTWEFFSDWGLTPHQFYEILEELTVDREIFNDESPIRHTMVGWQDLRAQDLRLHIITHRSPSAYRQTVQWLERYRLIPDSLHFSGQKADILSSLAVDEAIAVDDHITQCRDYRSAGIHTYAFDQPWNQQYMVRRVHSLPKFSEIIRLYNKYHAMENNFSLMEDYF